MTKSTISTFQVFEMFPDAEAARAYMEGKRWPRGAICPACSEAKRITTRKGGFYRCNACKSDFTVRTGTIFERSHVPLHKWLYAMYLLVADRKGISSLQLAAKIGVTQKSAWFMLQRLREACGNDPTVLAEIVCYIADLSDEDGEAGQAAMVYIAGTILALALGGTEAGENRDALLALLSKYANEHAEELAGAAVQVLAKVDNGGVMPPASS